MKEDSRVLAIKRGGALWSKRTFLKSAAATLAAGVAACSSADEKDDGQPPADPIPPFVAGGVTYRVVDLKDYNGTLPAAGKSLVVVGFVKRDFFFRSFDAQGTLTANHHESRIKDQTSLNSLKGLVTVVAEKKVAAVPAEQARFVDLVNKVNASAVPSTQTATQSGRRLQGSEARTGGDGKRLQGSSSSGRVSGRRLQGAEGRPEGDSAQRNLGTVVINGQSYNDTRIVESFSDGYTRVAHADGFAVVRTDALPEIVRMQLPIEVSNPGFRPSATTETGTSTTTTTTVSPPAPKPPPPAPRPRSTGGSHYWRPN